MHFALPPRKTSKPPQYHAARASLSSKLLPSVRRTRLKTIAIVGLVFLSLVWIVMRARGGGGSSGSGSRGHHKPSGRPPVVLVTVLDEGRYSSQYITTVRENRIQYAQKHGYATFFPKVGDYDLKGSPTSWTKVVAMRHTLTKFPDCTFVWYLDQDSFVMNPELKVEDHVMKASKLESMMIKDHPVVPPDSIIKTFGHLKGQDIDFVLSQDKEGLSVGSFLIRNGEWAKFFLETWFDPIYRSYNFQKAEAHALEHMVQWHPTVLSKLALIPQRTINAYNKGDKGEEYKAGDIAVRFPDCATGTSTAKCEADSQRFAHQWRTSFKNAR